MSINKLLAFFFVLFCQFALAQNDIIHRLKEVVVSDTNLKNFSISKSVFTISDSIIKKNQPSLTSLLNYNSTIYFKENGLGMVSSPSFRGTTAQQTAVVWNGININSQLLGQTDFNTISVRDFNSITVRSGGGSSIYGSGAIGGSIHLNTDLHFKNEISNDLFFNYGSFNTFGLNNKISISDAKTSLNFSISRNQSRNDYPYLDTDSKNENGQFENTSLNVGFGYQLNSRNILKLYSQYYDSERNFSGTLYSKSYSKYKDLNTRNLIVWNFKNTKFDSSLKLAHLTEQYKYFQNYNSDFFETSKVETALGNYNLGYFLTSKIKVNSIIEYLAIKGFGKNIGDNLRFSKMASVFFSHQISEKVQYDFSFRKEYTSTFESPFLFTFGIESKLASFYRTKFNVSKNFRVPTFNDLFWISGGNQNLKPETSLQAEFTNEITFKKLKINLNAYYNRMENMIRWVPTYGNWSPENVTNVMSYGLESTIGFSQKINKHFFNLNTSYAYTVSENAETKKQLTFVPYHKFTSNFEYNFKKFDFNYQHLYTGYVFTLSDNQDFLKGYQVANVGFDYDFGKIDTYKIGFQTLNIWNENYQSVPSRQMPGRNYTLFLNFKF
jgi:outer membrane cobalamin receptor